MTPAFVVKDLTIVYPGAHSPALANVSVEFAHGSVVAVIGPNGSGKSTLIRALLGALEPAAGEVLFGGQRVHDWPRRALARHIGAVTQLEEMPFPLTVRELVAMGRYPHLGNLRAEGETDRVAIERALQRCDVAHFAHRPVNTLSGGERQRARIARALAQEATTLVLDEPTVALDIGHEMQVFELLRSLAQDGHTVLVATHHLNLAARYADTLLLLDKGHATVMGNAHTVMQKQTLEAVYGWPLALHSHPGPGFDAGAPQLSPLSQPGKQDL